MALFTVRSQLEQWVVYNFSSMENRETLIHLFTCGFELAILLSFKYFSVVIILNVFLKITAWIEINKDNYLKLKNNNCFVAFTERDCYKGSHMVNESPGLWHKGWTPLPHIVHPKFTWYWGDHLLVNWLYPKGKKISFFYLHEGSFAT